MLLCEIAQRVPVLALGDFGSHVNHGLLHGNLAWMAMMSGICPADFLVMRLPRGLETLRRAKTCLLTLAAQLELGGRLLLLVTIRIAAADIEGPAGDGYLCRAFNVCSAPIVLSELAFSYLFSAHTALISPRHDLGSL